MQWHNKDPTPSQMQVHNSQCRSLLTSAFVLTLPLELAAGMAVEQLADCPSSTITPLLSCASQTSQCCSSVCSGYHSDEYTTRCDLSPFDLISGLICTLFFWYRCASDLLSRMCHVAVHGTKPAHSILALRVVINMFSRRALTKAVVARTEQLLDTLQPLASHEVSICIFTAEATISSVVFFLITIHYRTEKFVWPTWACLWTWQSFSMKSK